jgi:hypothetical protein
VFYLKLLPSLRARRTCHRSSFIHCRGVKRRVFYYTALFLNTAAMNINAVFFAFLCGLPAKTQYS